RAALRTTNKSGGDVWISGFPLDHELLGPFEVAVFHHYLRIRLGTRHKTDLLQRRLIVNIGVNPSIMETSFQLPRFGRLVERRNSHHKFLACASARIV